jgi:phosphotransferase system enzyme I (PtsI)
MKSIVRQAIGVSTGIAVGMAFVIERRVSHVPCYELTEDRIEHDLLRLDAAVVSVRQQLTAIEEVADRELGHDVAQIIDAQRLMLDGTGLVEPIRDRIRKLGQNVEWAVKAVGDDLSERFARIADPYLRERRNDLGDLTTRLLRTLSGEEGLRREDLGDSPVLFAYDLSPSETALLNRDRVLGFVTDVGGRTSHTAIMARSLQIPAVVGAHDTSEWVRTGDQVIVDGSDGTVVVHPDSELLNRYRAKQEANRRRDEALLQNRELPAISPDGVQVRLTANIESAEEAETAQRFGAAGVGLFRSEFLYLRSLDRPPDEETLYQEYRAVLEVMSPEPVTIRTLDLGGEKERSGAEGVIQADRNLLGVRGIRLSLEKPAMFEAQLRGLQRASVHGDLRIVFPLVTDLDEVLQAKAALLRARKAVVADGHAVAEHIPVGVMLEVPAAALIVDHLAQEVAFFSIGTNDLIQYLLAVDRNNDGVAHLYEPLHPAVLRLLEQIVVKAHERGIPVSLCGEAASDPLTALVFLGYGIDELSMTPSSVPVIKQLIRRVPAEDARQLLAYVMELRTAQEVEKFALERLVAHFPDGH